jgi:hypothetical protein
MKTLSYLPSLVTLMYLRVGFADDLHIDYNCKTVGHLTDGKIKFIDI